VDYLEGVVESVLFHKEETDFTIARVRLREQSSAATLFDLPEETKVVKGTLPRPKQGEVYRFHGHYEHHPKYGPQFAFVRYEKKEEASAEGVVEYFASDLFPGVGRKSAERIVETLGAQAPSKIAADPSSLDAVPRLSKKAKRALSEGLKAYKADEQTRIGLLGHGLSNRMVDRLVETYGDQARRVVEDNPYRLIEDVEGIGFERADGIARQLGFEADDPRRIRALLLANLYALIHREGHTHLTRERLIQELDRSLSSSVPPQEELNATLDALIEDGLLVEEKEQLTTPRLKRAEDQIVEALKRLNGRSRTIEESSVDAQLASFQAEEGIDYTAEQRRAVQDAMRHAAFVLTGGPGTGKTTVIKGLVHVFSDYYSCEGPHYDRESDIHLIAPTGRAAKRMNETTGAYASTIHRFLGYTYEGTFAHGRTKPKPGRLFIVDEASMLDVELAARLLESLPADATLVLVGDEAQLPSVGPGQVLKDILSADVLPVVRLEGIHRQARGSSIVEFARAIRGGALPDDLKTVRSDRYIFPERPENFLPRLKGVVDYFLKQGYDLYEDIQILIPMYRGETGIHRVNAYLQQTYNPEGGKALEHDGRIFRVGDKVLQLVNQAEDNVMNGDLGVVIGVDEDPDRLHVSFLGNEVEYRRTALDRLTHAYAISVHKSQGSEYPIVILPVFKSHAILLKRKLLYTAATRAESTLVVMGELEILSRAVDRLEDARTTRLQQKLSSQLARRTREAGIVRALDRLDADLEGEDRPRTQPEAEHSASPSPQDFLEGDPPAADATPSVSPYDFLDPER